MSFLGFILGQFAFGADPKDSARFVFIITSSLIETSLKSLVNTILRIFLVSISFDK